MIVICVVSQGIAESKTGVGDEDVRNTAVNLVMVRQAPMLFQLNIIFFSYYVDCFPGNKHFTLLSLICISFLGCCNKS